MKKLIAIILSLALVVCMFAVNVSAADVTVTEAGTKHVVGTHQTNNTIADGLTAAEFGSGKSAEAIVTLNLNAAQSRYAVDITFGGNYHLGVSGLVWDVNNLKYVYVAGDGTETISSDLAYTFEVVNYSDNDITVDAKCDTTDVFIIAALSYGFWAETTAKFTDTTISTTAVKGKLAGNVSGTAIADVSKVGFTAGITSADWEGSINKLVEAGLTGDRTLATFTITVAMAS